MNHPSLREELADILADLKIHSLTSFSFRGESHTMKEPASYQEGYATLLESLRNLLYGHCYVRPDHSGESDPEPNLTPQLRQANPTMERWESGWTIYQPGTDGRIMVQKGEQSRTAVQGEYVTNKAPGYPPQAGDRVSLHVHAGSTEMQQGFYFTFGDTLSDQYDEYALLRFYFNVTADAAVPLLHSVATEFNRFRVPFRYKTLTDARTYLRADAAVLYCAKRYHRIAMDILDSLPEQITDGLRPATPMFTKPIRPGIGMAEEPGTGESFGMHRCRLVAEGVLDSWAAGMQSPEASLKAVEKRFSATGLDMENPYLNAGSKNLFEHTHVEAVGS